MMFFVFIFLSLSFFSFFASSQIPLLHCVLCFHLFFVCVFFCRFYCMPFFYSSRPPPLRRLVFFHSALNVTYCLCTVLSETLYCIASDFPVFYLVFLFIYLFIYFRVFLTQFVYFFSLPRPTHSFFHFTFSSLSLSLSLSITLWLS